MSTPSGTPHNPYNGDDRADDSADGFTGDSQLPSYADYSTGSDPVAAEVPVTGGMYPGAGKRFGAFLIDSVLIGIIGLVLMKLLAGDAISEYMDAYEAWTDAGSRGDAPTLSGGGLFLATFITLVIWFLYRVILEVRTGQTLGKKLLAIRVADLNGSTVSVASSLKRNSWYIVVFLLSSTVGLIGGLVSMIILIVLGVMISRSPYGQHTFDQWAKAYVVNVR